MCDTKCIDISWKCQLNTSILFSIHPSLLMEKKSRGTYDFTLQLQFHRTRKKSILFVLIIAECPNLALLLDTTCVFCAARGRISIFINYLIIFAFGYQWFILHSIKSRTHFIFPSKLNEKIKWKMESEFINK